MIRTITKVNKYSLLILVAGLGTGFSGSAARAAVSLSQTGPQAKVQRKYKTDALLFSGDGTWQDEVVSLKSIFDDQHMTYREVSSADLNSMSVDDLASYGVIVWPGGMGGTQTESLTEDTH